MRSVYLAFAFCLAVALGIGCSVVNSPDDPVEPSDGGGTTTQGGSGPTNGGAGPTNGGGGSGPATNGGGGTGPGGNMGGSGGVGGTPMPVCGNNTVEGNEECDLSELVICGACDGNCMWTNTCQAPHSLTLAGDGQGNIVGSVQACGTGGASNMAPGLCDGQMGTGLGPEHLFSFTLMAPAAVRISVTSDFNAALRLMTQRCDIASQVPDLNAIPDGCVDQVGANNTETIESDFLPAGTYYLAVEGVGPMAMGAFTLDFFGAPFVDPIQNGSFETGDYTGWTVQQQSPGTDSTFGVVPDQQTLTTMDQVFCWFDLIQEPVGTFYAPITALATDGNQTAVVLSNGPDIRRMFQDVVLIGSRLEWDMAHFNGMGAWMPGSIFIQVSIRDINDAILAVLFETDPMFSLQEPTPLAYSADVSQFNGQPVRIDFEITGMGFFVDVMFDNVRLLP